MKIKYHYITQISNLFSCVCIDTSINEFWSRIKLNALSRLDSRKT